MELDLIRQRLDAHRPRLLDRAGQPRAAVALVLRDGHHGPEVLLIERAQRHGDPWSGHMAFPGGRLETDDRTPLDAARRETLEEVGVDLGEAPVLGRLDDLEGNRRADPQLVISAHVFELAHPPRFALDPREVQKAFFFPLAALHEEARQVDHAIPELPELRFPGIEVGEPGRHVVWGLTYRFLDALFGMVDRPFPDRWGELGRFFDRNPER